MLPLNGDDTAPALTNGQMDLMQACWETGSTNRGKLARYLCLSPHTIASRFREINDTLGTHGSAEALMVCIKRGLIQIKVPPPPRHREMRNRGERGEKYPQMGVEMKSPVLRYCCYVETYQPGRLH